MLNEFDKRQLRDVLGTFVTGVTIITTIDPDGRHFGLTANSFTSVSLDPPLVLWNQSLTAPSHPIFRHAPRFAVSILAEDQIHLSKRFASGRADKFEGVALVEGTGGLPLIAGAAAALECSLEDIYTGGDHALFIGRVERISRGERRPLVFAGGRYMTAQLHAEELSAS